jgi:c-di-AMP phosphodiesterase-like protein
MMVQRAWKSACIHGRFQGTDFTVDCSSLLFIFQHWWALFFFFFFFLIFVTFFSNFRTQHESFISMLFIYQLPVASSRLYQPFHSYHDSKLRKKSQYMTMLNILIRQAYLTLPVKRSSHHCRWFAVHPSSKHLSSTKAYFSNSSKQRPILSQHHAHTFTYEYFQVRLKGWMKAFFARELLRYVRRLRLT